jgi:hypothetical protein
MSIRFTEAEVPQFGGNEPRAASHSWRAGRSGSSSVAAHRECLAQRIGRIHHTGYLKGGPGHAC